MNKIKKFLVIGNPISHSLSPLIHNYWIKKSKVSAIYDKKLLENNDLKNFILKNGIITSELKSIFSSLDPKLSLRTTKFNLASLKTLL